MTNLTNIPLENAYETTISSSISSSDTSITVDVAPQFSLPAGQTVDAVIDPENSLRERVIITAVSGTTLTVTRGAADYLGDSGTAVGHSGGATIVITDSWSVFNDIATAVNSKINTADGALKAYADATARDAAIPSPSNGMQCFLEDVGKFYDYTAGSWVQRESGGTFANASTTVAGKVEEATAAELAAGTGTGTTGARMFVAPDNAAIIDDSAGVADAGKWGKLDSNGRFKASMHHLDSQSLEDDGSDNIQVKLDPAGGLTKGASGLAQASPTVGITAGESIDGSATPQCVAIAGNRLITELIGTSSYDFTQAPNTNANFGDAAATQWRASRFTTPNTNGTITITQVAIYGAYAGAPADNVDIEIWDDSSDLPNAIITNGQATLRAISDAWGQSANGYNLAYFNLTTPCEVTANTTYWIVAKRTGANDAGAYPIARYNNAGWDRMATYNSGGPSWSAIANASFVGYVNYSVTGEKGKLYKGDANAKDLGNIVGFTGSNVAATESASVQSYGALTISGLTAGDEYFLDTTAGAIVPQSSLSMAAGVAMVPVGTALTTTLLDIRRGVKRWFYSTLIIDVFSSNGNPAEAPVVTFNFECGFKPKKIVVHANIDDSTAGEDADTTNTYLGVQTLVFSDKSLTALDTSHRTVTAQTVVTTGTTATYSTDAAVAITSFNDTGFTATITFGNTARLSNLLFEVEG